MANLSDDTWNLQHARMEIHYETNGGFMEEGQLLKPENIEKIKHIPCSIVQGRYDIVCPPKTAWDFHKALPESKLYIIPDAGHSAKVRPLQYWEMLADRYPGARYTTEIDRDLR